MTDIWQKLSVCRKPVYLYGMGDGADKILDICEKRGIKITGVFASDGFARHQTFRGHTVVSYGEVCEAEDDFTVLVAFGTSRPEVLRNIYAIEVERELYAPDVPVFGENLFDSGFYLKNEKRLTDVRNTLADEISVKTFDAVINYKLSGDIRFLRECEVTDEESYSLLKLSPESSFMDLGAYNGDTVLDFVSHVPDYSRIYAVEPDRRSFGKLTTALENLKNVQCENVCIHCFDGKTHFEAKGGRSSSLSSAGSEFPCRSVDGMLDGNGVDCVKMDVEGNELNAIAGAEKTLKSFKPKLKIACYHRSEDLFTIPEAVFRINPAYKLYMRHNPYVPAWDTNYFFI